MGITVRLNSEDEATKYVTCNTCLHYHYTLRMRWSDTNPICKRRGGRTLNLVTGKIDQVNLSQLYECDYERDGSCGEKGIHWVPREKTKENTFKVLQRSGN